MSIENEIFVLGIVIAVPITLVVGQQIINWIFKPLEEKNEPLYDT